MDRLVMQCCALHRNMGPPSCLSRVARRRHCALPFVLRQPSPPVRMSIQRSAPYHNIEPSLSVRVSRWCRGALLFVMGL